MSDYFAPPNQTGLVLNNGDTLYVQPDGTATRTTINHGGLEYVIGGTSVNALIMSGGAQDVAELGHSPGRAIDATVNAGGLENVERSGTSEHTQINGLGVENVETNGTSIDTVVHAGGTENVRDHGRSTGTTIDAGGVENVGYDSRAINTTINGGVENVEGVGTAANVIFAGPDSTLKLARPSGLQGTISNFRVGDVIDFMNTAVTGVQKTGDVLTVTYGGDKASYQLAGQQANTEFKLQSDGHGGTDLVLTPIVGAHPTYSEAHHPFMM